MFTRVSTSSTQQFAIDSFQRRQSSLAVTQQQISSGLKYDTFAAIAKDGQTRRVVDFTSSLDQISTYQKNNVLLSSRLTAMDAAIDAMQDINTKAIAAMTQERSAVGNDNPLSQQMKAFLDQVEDQLNTNVDGRYLFAGSDTATRPAVSLQTSNLNTDNTATDNYYQGDAADLTQNISKEVTLQYNVRANNPAFQKLIAAMHLAIKAETNNDDALLQSAIDTANAAQKDLTGIRSSVDANLATIAQVNGQHDNFHTYYHNTLSDLTATDTAEASIQLSLDQAVLTASFQAFARVSNLTLSSFLRN